MRTWILVIIVLGTSGMSAAQAACSYNGVYYDQGAQICAEGWLQECTAADYWSAVGMCHANEQRKSDIMTRIGRLHPALEFGGQSGFNAKE